jgi:hypothetical protein
MKPYFNFIVFVIAATVVLQGCKKDENQVVFEGGNPPVLTASSTNSLLLSKDNKDKPILTLAWTNPNYRFSTGVSSHDVSYVIQVDTAGANFTSSNIQEMSVARDLGYTLTTKEINDFMTKMELKAGFPYNMEMRLKSTLGNGTVPLFSNPVQITIVPLPGFCSGTARNTCK